MDQSKKLRVAVLYGGRSGEHDVSLLSAANVIQQLDRHLFDVVPIGIDKQGAWFLGDDIQQKSLAQPLALSLPKERERLLFNPDFIGKPPHNLKPTQCLLPVNTTERLFDVVFPMIHGPLCEDGTVQGLLELTDVPYVGCGVLASAIGMDKDVSKRLVQAAGIDVVPYVVLRRGQWDQDKAQCLAQLTQQLRYPVFVKPANTGSSVGVEKVKSLAELSPAIESAFHYDTKIVVEKAIDAIELEIAVLESLDPRVEEPMVSLVGEVRPRHEFYSYAAKYLDEQGAEFYIPAHISEALQEKARGIAKSIFKTLECEGMARVDLFLERGTNTLYFNEINTIPGFTQISMYPKMMVASGISYQALLTHLIRLAVARHERKTQRHHEYGDMSA